MARYWHGPFGPIQEGGEDYHGPYGPVIQNEPLLVQQSALKELAAFVVAAAGVSTTAMAGGYWPNSILIREPRLVIPRAQPLGQVVVDWMHPLTRNLTYCWIGSQRAEVTRGYGLSYVNGASSVVFNGNKMASFDGVNDRVDILGAQEDFVTTETISGVIGFVYSDTVGHLIGRRSGNNSVDVDWEMYMDSGGSIGLRITNDWATWGGTKSVDNAFHVYGVSHASGDSDAYWDGALQANTASITPTTASTTTVDVSLGAATDDGFPYQGEIEFAFVWFGRILTAAEQDRMYRNPYQFLVPA